MLVISYCYNYVFMPPEGCLVYSSFLSFRSLESDVIRQKGTPLGSHLCSGTVTSKGIRKVERECHKKKNNKKTKKYKNKTKKPKNVILQFSLFKKLTEDFHFKNIVFLYQLD